MKKFSAVLLGIVFLFVPVQGVSATTTSPLQRPLCTISAYPNSVRLGGTVNLTWSSQYATAGSITSLGSVALYGSQGVIPTGEGTTYVGTFTGPGGTGTCSVRVSIILNDGSGGGDIDTSGDDEIDTSGTINNAGTVDKAGTVNKPGTLGAPPVQNAAPIMPGGSGGAPGSSATNRLVPCDGIDCQACKLALLGQNIINFLVGISIPLAAVMFAYAGFIYFSSSVIDKIEKAHKIFTSVLIGFAIVIGGYLIVETILHAIINKTYFESWNQIKCVPDSSRKTNATIQELLKNLSVTNSGTTYTGGGGGGGGGGTGTTGATGNDLDNRNILRDNGITVSSTGNCADQNNSNCTSLNGLQSSALSGAIDMQYNCGCSLNVSGGTETGHENGQYSHANGYKLDFSFNERLDNYIQGWTNTGRRGDNAQTYTSGNTVCAREDNHWDCTFR